MPKFWIFIQLEGEVSKENIEDNLDEFFGNASGFLNGYKIVVGEVK